jgi:hypothetical protein
MRMVLPPSSTGTFWKSPSGDDGRSSYARNVMAEGMSSGELSFYHTILDMMHVDAPSSMIHRWTMMFRIFTGI